jgi:hypothetical protein
MPKTIRGIGTRYYGASDRQPDGSFVTTEWLALFAPIIPLRSLRVRCLGKQAHGSRGSSEHYGVVGRAALDTKQVLQIYGLHLATWIVFFLPLILPDRVFDTASTVSAILVVAALAFWIWIVPGVLYRAD